MRTKTSRLPRRFDHVMKVLKTFSNCKNENVRLQAAMRMSEILLAHQQREERIAIATERASARRAEAEAKAQPAAEAEEHRSSDDVIRDARDFLARIGSTETTYAAS